jgi:hypothetical protein
MTPKAKAMFVQDIQDILAAARAAAPLPSGEPEELEETRDFEVYGFVANGCGHHEPTKENADFISPLLLAA